MKVYFDNAATTKVRDEVIDEISSVLKKTPAFAPISGVFKRGCWPEKCSNFLKSFRKLEFLLCLVCA